MVQEVSGSDRPPHVKILGEEARGHHPDAIVHPAFRQKLSHTRIDQRIPGPSAAPGIDPLRHLGIGQIRIGQPGKLGAQIVPGAAGVMVQHVGIELPPGQLQPEAMCGLVFAVAQIVQQGGRVHDA